MPRKKASVSTTVKVGNIQEVSGEVNIAGGDIFKGFTAREVSVVIKQITSTFQPKKFDGTCPYKGLDIFDEEDADLFFGREKLVDDLVSRVKESRTIFVTGPSGSGKSSLVRAGLLHALRNGAIKSSKNWLYETMKPGRDALGELARIASSFAETTNAGKEVLANASSDFAVFANWCEIALKNHRDHRAVLFIDQFEEVFTQLSKDKAETFINLLTHAATVENGRVTVLFSMRSDFVSNCATYPKLNAILNQQFVQIGAMQADELVRAIAQPALRVGLKIDPDLIAQIINDMEGEPGSLPLMQFALKDLFDSQQAQGGIIALKLNDYLQRGGIREALERHANETFSEFNTEEQELARSIFSGLIEVGRGTQDTRRTAVFDELIPDSAKSANVEAIVAKLADARLITTDEIDGRDTITISHEKLIDAWPWLKKLVNENRDVIALQNEISDDAMEWEEHNRDKSYLYTGIRLANAFEQIQRKKIVLSGIALDFLKRAQTQKKRTQNSRFASVVTSVFLVLIIIFLAYPSAVETIALSKARGEMVYIPAGPSVFGTENPDYVTNYGFPPKQTIEYLPAFQIGKYEVSNYQYRLCVRYGNCPAPFGGQADFNDASKQSNPVVDVTLYHANSYCRWLGQRLPTQFEWERAARGTNMYDWPWGNQEPTNETANMPWKEYFSNGPLPVNSNPAGVSAEGVYNLVGNVFEWTSSFSKDEVNTYNPTQYWNGDPMSYDGSVNFIQRGGSWNETIEEVGLYDLDRGGSSREDLGFRCAADAK